MEINIKDTNYFTKNSLEDIVKNTTSLGLPIVITPHKTQSTNIKYIEKVYRKTNSGIIKITPKEYFENYKNLQKFKHILIEDIELMKDFGYDFFIKKILNKSNHFFIFFNIKNETYKKYISAAKPINFSKFCINCKDEYIFLTLFILYKAYKETIIICKNVNKFKLFCEVMKMKCIIKDNYETTNKICLVVERYVEIENTKVIYIGFDLEYQKINIDYNKTSKYLYRIRDLVKQLTNDVVQGKRKLNYKRFKDIHKI